jgi:WD40 repeat protein
MMTLVGVCVAAVYWPDPHLVRTLSTSAPVNQVAFSPDGQFLASGGQNGRLCLWRVVDGQCIRALETAQTAILTVAFGPDGQLLASAGQGPTVQLWRVDDGQLVRTLSRPPEQFDWMYDVAFSPEGRMIAAGGVEGKIYLW